MPGQYPQGAAYQIGSIAWRLSKGYTAPLQKRQPGPPTTIVLQFFM